MSDITTLWVANTTKMRWLFTYRFKDDTRQHFVKPIEAGRQIRIDNLQSNQITDIVEQNAKYGMRRYDEPRLSVGFSGLLYRVEDAVPMDRMMNSFEINDTVRNAEAQTRRENTAASIADNMGETIHKATGRPKDQVTPARLEMEIVEETDGVPTVSAGVEVIANPAKTQPRRSRAQ